MDGKFAPPTYYFALELDSQKRTASPCFLNPGDRFYFAEREWIVTSERITDFGYRPMGDGEIRYVAQQV